MSNGINQEVWKKAWRVSQGIRKLLWAYDKFEPFFEWMNGYVDKNIVGC